jgi:hypothetical protein
LGDLPDSTRALSPSGLTRSVLTRLPAALTQSVVLKLHWFAAGRRKYALFSYYWDTPNFESTVLYLRIEADDALEMAEQTEV